MAEKDNEKDLVYFNGVNGTTGEYDLEPMTVDEFAEALLSQPPPTDKDAEGFYRTFVEAGTYAPADDADPRQLDQVGWGVLFAHDEDPAVIEALQPLLDWRRKHAGAYYYQYSGDEGDRRGYFPGETKIEFLEDRGAEPFGPVDPQYSPYYMLIVGDPQVIPFQFQYQLDVQYAVGRIHFRSPEEYAQYAQNVIAAEKEGARPRLPRKAVFFGTEHAAYDATYLSANYLIQPLVDQVADLSQRLKLDWTTQVLRKEKATKENLSSLLNGSEAPAFLFTATHGVPFNLGDPRQLDRQGALLCQDWSGTGTGAELEDWYFWADDVESSANLLGMIAFHFACYSAGTPVASNFYVARDMTEPPQLSDTLLGRLVRRWRCGKGMTALPQLASKPFVARLPHRLLLNGALAAVGHVERAWAVSIAYSTENRNKGRHLATYRSALRRLLDGYPVGSALEYFNQRYGEYSAALSSAIEERKFKNPKALDNDELVDLWQATNDARNYVILGDPAARMPLTEVSETPAEGRPALPNI